MQALRAASGTLRPTPYTIRHKPCVQGSAAEHIWHMYDSRGQILALNSGFNSLKPIKMFPLLPLTRKKKWWLMFKVHGTWFMVHGSGFRVQGSVWRVGRVQGSGWGVGRK